MPLWGRTDNIASKPKFPKLRLNHGVIRLSVNAATAPTTTLRFLPGATSGLANGWVVSHANVGNTSGTVGFNAIGPVIVNLTSNTITLSQNTTTNLTAGEIIVFSKPISLDANTGDAKYNSNTYLVTSTRRINASPSVANSVSHVGWANIRRGTGFVREITISGGRGYLPGNSAQAFLTITANNSFGANGSGANVGYAVNANGIIANTRVWSTGSGYVVTPGVTLGGINAVALRYISSATVTLGGWGYSNGTILTISGGTGSGANVVAYVNAAGALVFANVISSGGGWGSTAPTAGVPAGGTGNATVSLTMANGSNSTIVTSMGGRANRISTETLVVLSNGVASVATSGDQDFPGV